MFPHWHDHMHVPTVGDDVRIGNYMVIVDATGVRPESFEVSVEPGPVTGNLSERGRAIGALLQSTHEDTGRFLDTYLKPCLKSAEMGRLRVDFKNLLENYRSALDYTAHYLADFCIPKPSQDRVQFPVAKATDNATTFAQKLDRWFPGLSKTKPKVRCYLFDIQEFSGEGWLRQLADLANFNKHRLLSTQKPRIFHSIVVRYGDAGVRFGELGFKSLTLGTEGILRFVNSAGSQVDLEGPCVLDASITSLDGADPRIEVVSEKRQLYCIPGSKESVAGMLWTISKNVFRTVDRICALLS